MNSLGASTPEKAKSIVELSTILKQSVDEIRSAFEDLLFNGYVNEINGKFYVTDKGIIKLMRTFS